MIELAAELRAGQAVRAKRSDLILDEQVGGFGLGRFIVHGAGKKHGETVDLHPELRALVDEVLSTRYLCEAEAAYRRGAVADYFLFPTGKLSDSATQERIYQDPQNERVRARAAEARRNMRAFLTEADQKKAA